MTLRGLSKHAASALTPLQFMPRVSHRQQTSAGNGKAARIQLLSAVSGAPLYFRRARTIFEIMTDRKSSGSKSPPQNSDPRRTSNPPTGSKSAPETENTPKSSPNAAIPPDKLNAENDK
jgi:hypothetical protein